MPRAGATKNSGRRAKWRARRDAIIDTSARLFASADGRLSAGDVAQPFADIFMRGIER
jgi:hypothetical protein